MTTIDHTAYPYIMDMVISECSTLALLRFRATCRRLRDRADSILLKHAVLTLDDTARPPKIRLSTPEGERLPLRPELVRVLDIPCLWDGEALVPHLKRFTAVHTLRRSGRAANLPSACLPSVRTTIDSQSTQDPNIYHSAHVPHSTTRYVYHHRMDSPHMPATHMHSSGLHAGVRDCVMVYHPPPAEVRRCPPRRQLQRFLSLLLTCDDMLEAGGSLTIVGTEAVLTPMPDGLHGVMAAVVPSYAAGVRDFSGRQTRTLTMEQWLSELEAEGRGLEGRGWFNNAPRHTVRAGTPRPD